MVVPWPPETRRRQSPCQHPRTPATSTSTHPKSKRVPRMTLTFASISVGSPRELVLGNALHVLTQWEMYLNVPRRHSDK